MKDTFVVTSLSTTNTGKPVLELYAKLLLADITVVCEKVLYTAQEFMGEGVGPFFQPISGTPK